MNVLYEQVRKAMLHDPWPSHFEPCRHSRWRRAWDELRGRRHPDQHKEWDDVARVRLVDNS